MIALLQLSTTVVGDPTGFLSVVASLPEEDPVGPGRRSALLARVVIVGKQIVFVSRRETDIALDIIDERVALGLLDFQLVVLEKSGEVPSTDVIFDLN